MSDYAIEEANSNNVQARVLVAGALIGLVVGLGAAYVYLRQIEESDSDDVGLSVGETVGLGVALVGLISQVSRMGRKGD